MCGGILESSMAFVDVYLQGQLI